jgi:toxic anion resistance protein, tela family
MKKEDLKDEVIQGEVVIEEVEKTDEEKEIENLLNLEKPAILEENYKVVRKQSSEVKALVKEIDVTNAGTILNFGAKPAEELSQISNEILRTSKNVENIEATAIIKNLTKLIKKVDISDFEKAPKKETGILSIFSKVFNSGKNLIAKYENMNKEIEVIAKELLQYKVDIEKDQNDLKSLYEAVSKHSIEINDYILATELAEEEVQKKLDDIKDTVNVDENDKNREIAKTQTLLDMISQKKYDLETVKAVSLQTLPMIEIMAKNNIGLARKIHSSLITTLPIFVNAIILALQTRKQIVLKNTFVTLDKTTEELMERNAVNIVRTSKEIAEVANTSPISIESLKRNFEIVQQGIKETKEKQEKARKDRINNIKLLNQLNAEMEKNKIMKLD